MRRSIAVLAAALGLIIAGRSQQPPPLRLEQSIPLPEVQGRIDHLAADLKHKRLFVAALGNNTVEVLDLAAGKRIHSIAGLDKPQGLLYLTNSDRLLAANGGNGACRVFAGLSLRALNEIKLAADAGNIRLDNSTGEVYAGYGKGALAVIDAVSASARGEIPLEGHPESFELESDGPRIFVNVPGAGHIAVADRHKRTVVSKWALAGAAENFPMALDEKNHLLFTGCRKPPAVLVFDTATGRQVARFTIHGDTDDLFYDARHKRLYASCGEGFLDVIQQRGAREYESLGAIPTAPGARTCLFEPELERVYVAVPARAGHGAEIRIYQVQP